MVKVSIIIPVYNTEKYLKNCLYSVVNQTLKDIEIICINDGSTDNSIDILNYYSKKDPRIIVINQENEGVSAARNIGIEKAGGEYLMFLDSDDYLDNNACKTAYNYIKENDADVGIFGHYILKGKRLKQKIATGNPIDFINIWDKIFKTSFIKNNNIKFPINIKTAEDIIFSYTINFYNPKTLIINELLMVYRDTRKGSSTEDKLSQIKTDIDAFEYFINTEIYKSQSDEKKLIVINKFSELIVWLASKAKTKEEKVYSKTLISKYFSLIENFNNKDILIPITNSKNKWTDKIYSTKLSDDEQTVIRNIFGIKFKSKRYTISQEYNIVSDLYEKHISNIKRKIKKTKIRIGFYVNNEIWKCQNLYNLMAKSKHYEPFIIVGKNNELSNLSQKQQEDNLKKIYNCFVEKNMTTYLAYDYNEGKALSIRTFEPDIVFYSRPWGLEEIHGISVVSKFALTCYVPYFISNSPAKLEAGGRFQNLLWRYYVLNNDLVKEYTPVMENNGNNLKTTGYPTLDTYCKIEYNYEKKYVIYAPHWSVGGNAELNYATFEWNGEYILNYAKKHPEIKWVFKPHPNLANSLLKFKIWTQDKIDNYYNEWDKIGIKYEGTDYFELFKQSKVLITDCGSFLAEYMPTKNPVILLCSPIATPYNFLAQKITKYYYKAHDLDELATLFENVIIKNEDNNKYKRLRMLDELQLITNSSENILNDLNTEFNIK